MTDSTPDDKNLPDEAAATEETVQDTVDEAAEETADATEEAATKDEAPTEKVSTAKKAAPAAKAAKRPTPPVEDDDEDDVEEASVRRPKASARTAATRNQAAGLTAGATVTTVVITVVILALLAASITFGVLWGLQKSENSDIKAAAAEKAQAEKVAAEYAAGASTFDYKDLTPWRNALTTRTSDDLKKRFEATVGAMNQLLQPLQWVSKGTVKDAVVNSQSGPIFKVSVYVNIDTTTVQNPAGRSVLTLYNVTLDKDKDWQISDVGGEVGASAAALEQTPATPAPTETAPAPPAPGN
ncbi:hypothetical protein [Tsukamurella ocularis]|uniref:hypothetical protein n=1 Tax=Tsukamurella ocularis TaxID=1970234 RepID=UPI002166EEE7|nr:hypothetical protein [Tsukamurella ocularis]MCS3780619.1 Mce-associated membrane protein [Tsukamurella ocularis]MCS3786443.1 Mce-associated membrane protein [Tsukamurella ocularis]MCS3850285.1 Mce-associated membrane protein [Tsukamurella ocularis]